MPTLRTIGVYGFDRDSFLAALADANVELLLDVRQRRGVRGSEYAWANAQRLEASLAEAGIDYTHLKGSPPRLRCAKRSTARTRSAAREGAAAPPSPPYM